MTYKEKLLDPKWQNKSGIYKIIINNNIYVGSAVNLPKRLMQHFNRLRENKHCNIHLQRAYNLYRNIEFEILEIVEYKSNLIQREQYFIDTLKPKYNISPVAGSQLGFRHSEKSKELISVVQTGKKLSPETCRRMSESKKGILLNEAHRKKISLSKMGSKNPFYRAGKNHPQYGKQRSESTKLKISKNNPEARVGVLYDVETGANYIFRSLRKICRQLNLNYNTVKGTRRRGSFYLGRYHTSFVDDIPENIETIIKQSEECLK